MGAILGIQNMPVCMRPCSYRPFLSFSRTPATLKNMTPAHYRVRPVLVFFHHVSNIKHKEQQHLGSTAAP